LATGSEDKTARLFDAASGKELGRVIHEGKVTAVAWSPNGQWLATGTGDFDEAGSARIVQAPIGEELARVPHIGAVFELAWSPDGRRLAIGWRDTVVRIQILEAVSGKKIAHILQGDDSVIEFAWSPDGHRLATLTYHGKVLVFDTESGKALARVAQHEWAKVVAWKPQSTATRHVLSTGSVEGFVRLWTVFATSQALVDAAKARAARCLTQEQRAQYFLSPAPPTWCVERRLWPYSSETWQAWLPHQKAWLASGRRGDAPPLPMVE
jgi:WD40 repeat protein